MPFLISVIGIPVFIYNIKDIELNVAYECGNNVYPLESQYLFNFKDILENIKWATFILDYVFFTGQEFCGFYEGKVGQSNCFCGEFSQKSNFSFQIHVPYLSIDLDFEI